MPPNDGEENGKELGKGPRKYTHDEVQQLHAQMTDHNRRAENPRGPTHRQVQRVPRSEHYGIPMSDDEIRGPLHPISGHCLCEDFTLVVLVPRAGTILCHCVDCQINGASFFGAYVVADCRENVILVPQNRDYGELRDPEIGIYDAQPISSGTSCPRTFCKTCGTMLYAEPASLKGVVVANAGLFQNHGRHPALIPKIEIFTSQRLKWFSKGSHEPSTDTAEYTYRRMPRMDANGVPVREMESEDEDEDDEGEAIEADARDRMEDDG